MSKQSADRATNAAADFSYGKQSGTAEQRRLEEPEELVFEHSKAHIDNSEASDQDERHSRAKLRTAQSKRESRTGDGNLKPSMLRRPACWRPALGYNSRQNVKDAILAT